MSKARSFSEALKEAQDRGIAETDPSLDIQGWDTANKLLICCYGLLGLPSSSYNLSRIRVEGIEGISQQMIDEEKAKGNVYKLVASAKRSGKKSSSDNNNDNNNKDDEWELSVLPTILSKDEFLAGCDGWEMGVEIHR